MSDDAADPSLFADFANAFNIRDRRGHRFDLVAPVGADQKLEVGDERIHTHECLRVQGGKCRIRRQSSRHVFKRLIHVEVLHREVDVVVESGACTHDVFHESRPLTI